MKIFTNRYRDFRPAQGIPVRITYGAPKWRLPYVITASAKTVTPGPWFMQGTDEEFTERYRAMLDRHGVEKIRAELQTISDLNGGKDVVLLCFDDISKGLCHRTLFAEWWRERTGETVRELQENANVNQIVLF